MRVLVTGILIVTMSFMICACATIFKGNSSTVDFSSDPSGATVHVNGFPRGKTPVKLKLESKTSYQIEFKKDGYEPRVYTITNHVGGGWIILDVLFGLVPVVIDAATGSWYELDQDAVNAILEQEETPETTGSN